MHTRFLILFFLMGFVSCQNTGEQSNEKEETAVHEEMKFDEAKWKTKDDGDYPHRAKMLNDILYNDSIRALHKDEILDLLGEPDRVNENYLYYTINKKSLGFWTLHARTMVIKFSGDDTIEWIKIHE